MEKYTNAKDCWEAVKQAKTIEEVEDLINTFPGFGGYWEVRLEDGVYTLYHGPFYNPIKDTWQTWGVELNVELAEEDK